MSMLSVMKNYNQRCMAVYSVVLIWIQYLALYRMSISHQLIKTFE